MDLNIQSGHIYIGRSAGKPIEKALKGARSSIEICSPYLSPSFVNDLVNKRTRDDVSVTLVTTNEFLKGKDAPTIGRALVKQVRHVSEKALHKRKKLRLVGGLAMGASVVAALCIFKFAPSDFITYYALAALGFLVGLIMLGRAGKTRIYSYSYHSTINVVVVNAWDPKYCPENYLIHTKAYVVDEKKAHLGSCNFSLSGFIFNHEFRLDLDTPDDAKALSDEIRNMAGWLKKKSIPIETLGKMFYKEKPY